jgi:hypothetical protein
MVSGLATGRTTVVGSHLERGWEMILGFICFTSKIRHRALKEGLAVNSELKGEGDTGATQASGLILTGSVSVWFRI